MAHKIYENFVLANEIEDQYASMLDMQQFCKVDNDLVGTPGMIKKINVYKATDGTEKLAMGDGNSKSIEVDYTQKEYKILLAQNRFDYYDEQEMTDPMLVPVGTNHMAVDMFNTVNADIFAEFNNATLAVAATKLDFGAFADAVATLNIEYTDNDPAVVAPACFAFINPKDVAALRKNLGDELRYVEQFVRTGYIGTVGGVNLFTKKNAEQNKIIVATNEAVTLFNKRGVEVEQARDENTRKNSIWSRKYYLAALTDATKACIITVGNGS